MNFPSFEFLEESSDYTQPKSLGSMENSLHNNISENDLDTDFYPKNMN
jgi:hypothetical protein